MKLYVIDNPFNKCYYIEIDSNNKDNINKNDQLKIRQIILDNRREFIPSNEYFETYIEIGPRRNFKTSWNSNMCGILKKCGLPQIKSIEFTNFYPKDFNKYDKMLYEKYQEKVPHIEKEKVYYVDNIEEFNIKNNLGFDRQDLEYYHNLFLKLDRKPTNVELIDLSQCNSEHARHWFFRGKFSIDGITIPELNLMSTLKKNGYKFQFTRILPR